MVVRYGVVKDLVEKVSNESNLDPDLDLFDSGILDSLLLLELVGELETKFSFKFRVEQITSENFRTISRLEKLVLSDINES